VTDEGPGMLPDVRGRACEPFFSTKDAGHTGIGLTVARAIAERHGGSLEIVSRPENGTTAVLVLPAAAERDAHLPADIAAVSSTTATGGTTASAEAGGRLSRGSDARNGPGSRILVVDDERDVLDAVCELLSALGHGVEAVDSGEAALALLPAGRWDAVVTDQGMPGLSGRELARRAAVMAPGVPVVLLTGWPGALDDQTSDGIAAVVAKPVTLHTLRDTLDRVHLRPPVSLLTS